MRNGSPNFSQIAFLTSLFDCCETMNDDQDNAQDDAQDDARDQNCSVITLNPY